MVEFYHVKCQISKWLTENKQHVKIQHVMQATETCQRSSQSNEFCSSISVHDEQSQNIITNRKIGRQNDFCPDLKLFMIMG